MLYLVMSKCLIQLHLEHGCCVYPVAYLVVHNFMARTLSFFSDHNLRCLVALPSDFLSNLT